MRPEPGQVIHFSEDPTITRFHPHVARTASSRRRMCGPSTIAAHPTIGFPRHCPRALAWVGESTSDADRDRIIGAGCGERVHAIEYGWLEAMRTTQLYAYRLPAHLFRAIGAPDPYAHVAAEPVEPLGRPEPVGGLLRCHEEAGIQLRVLDNLWPFWDQVTASTVGWSGIRLRNARPRPTSPPSTSS
jgi:hypothetical protein